MFNNGIRPVHLDEILQAENHQVKNCMHRRQSKPVKFSLLIGLSLLFLFTNANLWAKDLYFSAIPHDSPANELIRYNRVAKFLSARLGIDVTFIPSKDYEETISLFKQGKIQLAWFGGLSGVMARQQTPNAKVIAQGFEDQHFKSYFIAHRDSGLTWNDKLPANTKQLTLSFGPKLSTSGRLMPEFFLRELYLQPPENLFKSISFSPFHKETINRVLKKKVDIGVVNYTVWLEQLQSGNIQWEDIIVIWETPEYHDYHWLSHPAIETDYDNITTADLTRAILAMSSDRNIMRTFGRGHFVRANNQQFNKIENIARSLGLIGNGSAHNSIE